MSTIRIFVLISLAMIAFAGNSLLCRVALTETAIDAASFTTIRLVSGAMALLVLLSLTNSAKQVARVKLGGNSLSALALFAYAAGFSFAYIELSAATGALLLFGSVQLTMIGYGLVKGERLGAIQMVGVVLAIVGMVVLFLPGLSAPPFWGTALMCASGIAWGIYSLRGRGVNDATRETTGNFVRSLPFALILSLLWWGHTNVDMEGAGLAIASGALASGIGYAIWYAVLPALSAASAAIIQLSVPPLAAIGAVFFLDEPISLRLGLASLAILGGIALFILSRKRYA
ncbi:MULTISPECIES: DMT family transporter [Thiomicrorhabdus]|uniref:DMT family transporter n=1 Tax=Thiomicrorhabdus heinhorstiae TaxID=2748010 RepID=A0ABS0BZJ9_9GAMM|nr:MULTISPECIES: DMT family transporter [Thiomicrorhabdus]MBF6057421.1 DMT family transporter [Thiomicrorhabdus heinhorstiae]